MNDFPVFSSVMAHQLSQEGFKYLRKGISKKDPRRYIYYFENTETIQKRVNEIVKELKKC